MKLLVLSLFLLTASHATKAIETNTPLCFWQNATQHDFPGKYPYTATRVLKAAELQRMSKDELRIMRNEIYARYGMIFKTPLMKSYFSNVDGYNPRFEDVSKKLNKIENQNVSIIKGVEDKK